MLKNTKVILSILSLFTLCFIFLFISVNDADSVEGDSNEHIITMNPNQNPCEYAADVWNLDSNYVLVVSGKYLPMNTGVSGSNYVISISFNGSSLGTINLGVFDSHDEITTGQIDGVANAVLDYTDESKMNSRISITLMPGSFTNSGQIEVSVAFHGLMMPSNPNLTKTVDKIHTIKISAEKGAELYEISSIDAGYVKVYKVTSEDQKITRSEYAGAANANGPVTKAQFGQLLLIEVYPSDDGKISSLKVKTGDEDLEVKKVEEYLGVYSQGDNAGQPITSDLPRQHIYYFTMPNGPVQIDVTFNWYKLDIQCDNGAVKEKVYSTKEGVVQGLGASATPGLYKENSKEITARGPYYFEGDTVELTPTPNEGYEFKGWETVSGTTSVSGNRITIGSSDVVLKAVFQEKSHTITYKGCEGGTVTGPSSAAKGAKVVLSVSPSAGYVIDKVSVTSGGSAVAVASDFTFIMPDTNVEVSATFVKSATASTMTCSSTIQGSNTVLKINIDCSSEVGIIKDPRILVVAKYGNNVVNVYSKPVLDGGRGEDCIFVSTLGLSEVVMQLVDGIQPDVSGSITSYCYTSYSPTSP